MNKKKVGLVSQIKQRPLKLNSKILTKLKKRF